MEPHGSRAAQRGQGGNSLNNMKDARTLLDSVETYKIHQRGTSKFGVVTCPLEKESAVKESLRRGGYEITAVEGPKFDDIDGGKFMRVRFDGRDC